MASLCDAVLMTKFQLRDYRKNVNIMGDYYFPYLAPAIFGSDMVVGERSRALICALAWPSQSLASHTEHMLLCPVSSKKRASFCSHITDCEMTHAIYYLQSTKVVCTENEAKLCDGQH